MTGDSEVVNTVYDTIRASGVVTVIDVDGDVYTVDKISASIPKNVSSSKKQVSQNRFQNRFLMLPILPFPKTGEVDVLKGLINVARNLDDSCDDKTVLYLGAVLQTTGNINFTSQNLFETDTEVIISQLKEEHAIPDFPEGIKVIFAGAGDTAIPQNNLSYSQIANCLMPFAKSKFFK